MVHTHIDELYRRQNTVFNFEHVLTLLQMEHGDTSPNDMRLWSVHRNEHTNAYTVADHMFPKIIFFFFARGSCSEHPTVNNVIQKYKIRMSRHACFLFGKRLKRKRLIKYLTSCFNFFPSLFFFFIFFS